MQKIYFNNFLSDENNEVIDIDARNVQVFDADMNEAAKFLKEHKGYQITIATDYQERVKEVLSDYDIFDINFIKNITSQGTEIQDGKILLLTDRELLISVKRKFRATEKDITKKKPNILRVLMISKKGSMLYTRFTVLVCIKGLPSRNLTGS